METGFLSFKLIHFLGFIVWIGGLMNLSRMLGAHVREEPAVRERLSRLERKMYYLVCVPGLTLTLIAGIGMLFERGLDYYRTTTWLHIKLLLVFVLIGFDFYTLTRMRSLKSATAMPSAAPFKIIHGTIGLLLIAILALAVFKRPVGGS